METGSLSRCRPRPKGNRLPARSWRTYWRWPRQEFAALPNINPLWCRRISVSAQNKSIRLIVASSNAGKLREYRALAASAGASLDLQLIPNFDALPKFDEAANTFAENALGKALHYSRFSEGLVISDDSGLVVPALGGAPGVHSARYAGPDASDADRINKLVDAMRGKKGADRRARFVCVAALVERGEAPGIFFASPEGGFVDSPRGGEGVGD